MKGYWEHRAKLLKLLGRELTVRELEFAIFFYFTGDNPKTVASYIQDMAGR